MARRLGSVIEHPPLSSAGRQAGRAGLAEPDIGRHFRYMLLLPVVILLMFGLVMVFSAGSAYGIAGETGYRLFVEQLAWIGLGLVLLLCFSVIDYRLVAKLSFLMVVVSIALLIAVYFIGIKGYGARRWIHIWGPISVQPSEVAKFATIIFAAYSLFMKREKAGSFLHFLIPVVFPILALECLLILFQPDLGSMVILFLAVLIVMAVSDTRIQHVSSVAAVGALLIAVAIKLKPYRFSRVLTFLNPWKDPTGSGYQIIQSYIAFGTGGFFGLGPGMSRQKFLYLPNAHNDFIFSIVGEELGFFGAAAVLAMFGLILFAGLRIAKRAPDALGRTLAAGITSLIVIQALVNMGGVVGIMPLTGVTLPFVSAGGSSMVIFLGLVGILLNIESRSFSKGGSKRCASS